MKAKLLAKLRDPKTWRSLAFLGAVYGAKHLWEETFSRLDELEGELAAVRGTVPLDDVVTLAELQKVERDLVARIDARPAEGA